MEQNAALRDAGGGLAFTHSRVTQLDISRNEQRVLHVLAQGGNITPVKDSKGRIAALELYNRDGWRLPLLDPALFRKLKRRKTVASQGGGPYRITRRGLELVRSEYDNR
jgi:uncharacterized protein YjhX (UPF0386 family)